MSQMSPTPLSLLGDQHFIVPSETWQPHGSIVLLFVCFILQGVSFFPQWKHDTKAANTGLSNCFPEISLDNYSLKASVLESRMIKIWKDF